MQKKCIFITFAIILIFLCACQDNFADSASSTLLSSLDVEPTFLETAPPETEIPFTGWSEIDGKVVYLESNLPYIGWLDLEEGLYYLDNNGHKTVGWLVLDGKTYYFHDDGRAACGKLIINESTYYFSSHGELIPFVNQWNPLPIDYAPEVKEAVGGCWVETRCAEALHAMLTDLENEVGAIGLLSGYRSYTQQYNAFYGSIEDVVQSGRDYQIAYEMVKESVAIPGTSEHQLGLAVDVMNPHDLFL